MDQNFKHFSDIPRTEVYQQLQAIKRDLGWLDETIALTKDQRELFVDIKTRVRELLGYNR